MVNVIKINIVHFRAKIKDRSTYEFIYGTYKLSRGNLGEHLDYGTTAAC